MSGTIYSVSSVEELYVALNTAQGGDTIELEAGEYNDVILREHSALNAAFDTTVTLKSADPGDPAVITYMGVSGAKNLKFEDLVFDYQASEGDDFRTKAFQVLDSTDISFVGCHFIGDSVEVPGNPDLDGMATANGLFLRDGKNLLVEDCEFEGFARGLMVAESEDIVVRGNEFHHQRMDHMVNDQVLNMVIEDNYMHDHAAAPGSADHPDFIQFWNDGDAYSSANVIIRNNIMVTGEGQNSTQVIYVSNGAVNRQGAGEEMFFKNFSITDNVIVGSHRNAICVDQIDGLEIARNTVITELCVQGTGALYTPGIVVKPDSTNVVIVDNITPSLYNDGDQPTWHVDNNLLIQDEDPTAEGYYGDIFINAVAGERSVLENIQIIPGSAADGLGAWQLVYNEAPDAFTALVHLGRNAEIWTDFTFDASYSAGPDGRITDKAVVTWDFGDGTSDIGLNASHTYSASGTYIVTMSVESQQGTDVTTTQVTVGCPEVLKLDAQAGTFIFEDVTGEQAVATALFTPDQENAASARHAIILDTQESAFKIEDENLPSLANAQGFQLDLSLASEDWATGSGEILRVHNAFVLTAKADGTVFVQLILADGSRQVLTSTQALNSGDWSDLTVAFDGRAGVLSMEIDGIAAGQAEASGVLSDYLIWGLNIGANYGRSSFTGALGDLTIQVNQMAYEGLDATAPIDTLSLLDGFDLKDALADGGEAVIFKGDAVQGPDGVTVLDGVGDSLQLDRHDDGLDLGTQFTMALDWQQENDTHTRLAWKHGQTTVEFTEGGLRVGLRGADGRMKKFFIEDLDLVDGESHQVVVSANEETDQLQVMLDDILILEETATDFQFSDAADYHWMLGGAWGGWLDGQIENFRLDNDTALALAEASTVETLLSETAQQDLLASAQQDLLA